MALGYSQSIAQLQFSTILSRSFFWKLETSVNELDPNFISLELNGGGFSVKIK